MALNLKKRDLSKYDLEVFVDISGSMETRDTSTRQTRLDDCREKVSMLVEECEKIDTDGVTFGFFNNSFSVYENTTFAKVGPLFAKTRPNGSTDTAALLQARIDDYFGKRFGKPKAGLFSKATPADPKTKPRILVVWTDGVPDDQKAVVKVIVNATKRLTAEGLGREALGISFIQVGRDVSAKNFLVELDDELKEQGATLDIVNCLTMEHLQGMTTQQMLERALDD